MSAYQFAGLEMSRSTVMMMLRSDQEARREQQQAEAEAEARREQAEGNLRRYYTEHGEWPHETMARQQAVQAQREAAAEARRAQERRDQRDAYAARMLAEGRKPRSLEQILDIYRLMP